MTPSVNQFLAPLIKSCRYFPPSMSSVHRFYKYQNSQKLDQTFFHHEFQLVQPSSLWPYEYMTVLSRTQLFIPCFAHLTPPASSAVSNINFLFPPPKPCRIPTSDQIIPLNSIFKGFIFQVGTLMLSPILSLPLCRSFP